MGNNGGNGGNGGGRSPVFVIVLIIVIAAVFGGNAFAQNLVSDGLSLLKTLAIIFGVGVVLAILAAIGIAFWAKRKEIKQKEAEQALQILNTPLETFGDLETQQLMDKYDGKENADTSAGTNQNGQKSGFVNPYSAKNSQYQEDGRVQQGR